MSKDKWVRRFSVNETSKHKDGFTIYKITSVLFPIQSPEAMTEVCVWKRYSEVRRLHASMKTLHAGLHLRGTFPTLPSYNYFKRFQQEVIEERAKVIKSVLEFIAEHQLLFTSIDFVNFLQSGYEPPREAGVGVGAGTIAAIRSSLQLPPEHTPPLEYRGRSEHESTAGADGGQGSRDVTDFSRILVHEPFDVEVKSSPVEISRADSLESVDSLDSIGSVYSELDKVTIQNPRSQVKRNVLPDLIDLSAPSTSKFDDYHTMTDVNDSAVDSESLSTASNNTSKTYTRSNSRVSDKSILSLSNISNLDSKIRTEDSYVFEAGTLLNLARRYENTEEYSKAFECYKEGIEKMLTGVRTDTVPQRRVLIKEKINKFLSYAEIIYKRHLCDVDAPLLSTPMKDPSLHCSIPLSMIQRPYEDLALYRVIAILGSTIMLVLHTAEQTCYAMKVIQKIPTNLTEFEYNIIQNVNQTRYPVLPTVIPYMVPLHSYVETNNLYFLILHYAPGEKLLDYIKNYAKSLPHTPAREVNLENVFNEPKIKDVDLQNDNLKIEIDKKDSRITVKSVDHGNNTENNNEDVNETDEVTELVKNSQKLLQNVNKVLSQSGVGDDTGDVTLEDVKVKVQVDIDVCRSEEIEPPVAVVCRTETPSFKRSSPRVVDVLPPCTACRWGAQIVTALESLHNCGVICRDLNPSNVLLGANGQIILTYFVSYHGVEMSLAKLQAKSAVNSMYIAPELYTYKHICDCEYYERDDSLDKVCDFWSFGAIMYELLCGLPLSYYHRGVFTSHTILQMPDGLPVEVQSLLTQLLTYEPSERLGAGKDGIKEIKRHPYFKNIDWTEIYDSWTVPD